MCVDGVCVCACVCKCSRTVRRNCCMPTARWTCKHSDRTPLIRIIRIKCAPTMHHAAGKRFAVMMCQEERTGFGETIIGEDISNDII